MPEQSDFDRLFHPKSVAIIGASAKRGTARNRLLLVMQKHGYEGRIYPVSRSADEIEGLKAYATLDALPETPDVALIITPAETVPEIIADCGRNGVPSAIVFSSGFEETESGKELARQVAEAAREHNVRVLGTNCQGLWSVAEKAMLTFGSAPFALDRISHAPIAVISQSGALGGAIGNTLQRNLIGCSYVVSVGNETSTDLLDCLAYVIEQDDVRVVGLYLEGLNDASRIVGIAQRARERGIQIVALKTGKSEIGRQATASHTGKIATAHVVYAGVLDQAGVLLVDNIAEMVRALEVFAFLPAPRNSGSPQGGVSIMSTSGGAASMLADHSDEFDVPLSVFSQETVDVLDRILPDYGHKHNPVDLTGQVRTVATLLEDTLAAVSSDPHTEALVVQFASSGTRDVEEKEDAFASAARAAGVPAIVSLVNETVSHEMNARYREAGILISSDTSETMKLLAWLYRKREWDARPARKVGEGLAPTPIRDDWRSIMDLLDGCGIAPAKWAILSPADDVAQALGGMSFPVAVKVLPSDAEHKTEMGVVKINVRAPEEVATLAGDFRARLGKPEAGILVQEMVGGDGTEVVLSCLRNEEFGPVLSIGFGGIAVELFRDVTFLSLPATPEEIVGALQKLKLWTVLNGFRGAPKRDIGALVEAAVKLGERFVASEETEELEINPVFVLPEGQGLVAVDALVRSRG
ncbi:acetate--CoA ligase family protein [Celeribacter indicus]|uniref:CoA-binding protein n=1 Tax=Celeribacter indicus TaxID=1208324 RepID=A0A0B5E143_9RHOB|nr:acetate--CoA ligase family protein [Celeribacter indicus]AJE46726.1 CoA-binding protein [Celeribacter indicus]SDX04909.1 Acyl-CoA synthetase (NDP forming) [Celeribacter indicus]